MAYLRESVVTGLLAIAVFRAWSAQLTHKLSPGCLRVVEPDRKCMLTSSIVTLLTAKTSGCALNAGFYTGISHDCCEYRRPTASGSCLPIW